MKLRLLISLQNATWAQEGRSIEGEQDKQTRFFAPVTLTLTRGNSVQPRSCCIHRYHNTKYNSSTDFIPWSRNVLYTSTTATTTSVACLSSPVGCRPCRCMDNGFPLLPIFPHVPMTVIHHFLFAARPLSHCLSIFSSCLATCPLLLLLHYHCQTDPYSKTAVWPQQEYECSEYFCNILRHENKLDEINTNETAL